MDKQVSGPNARETSAATHREWTAAEDKIVLDKAMPDQEIARQLNRTVKAVNSRRARLRHLGTHRSEGRGKWKRPLPAHGTLARYDRGCRCTPCATKRRETKRRRYELRGPEPAQLAPERAEMLRENLRRKQAETRAAATRNREPWTAEDFAIALDYRYTAAEAARLIGRSLSAVRNARGRHKAKPYMLPYRPRSSSF